MSFPSKDAIYFIIDLATKMYAKLTVHNLYHYAPIGAQKYPYDGMGPNFETLQAQVVKTYSFCNATIVQALGFPSEEEKEAMTNVLNWGPGREESEGKYSVVMQFSDQFLNSSVNFINCFGSNFDKNWVPNQETTSCAYTLIMSGITVGVLLAFYFAVSTIWKERKSTETKKTDGDDSTGTYRLFQEDQQSLKEPSSIIDLDEHPDRVNITATV